MCNPMMVMSGVMMAASAHQNKEAQNDVIGARNEKAHGETMRQQKFQGEADQINQGAEALFTREAQDKNLGDRFLTREQYIQDAMPDLGVSGIPISNGAPSTVKSDLGARIADALSYGRNFATSQAKLGSFGANQFDNQLALANSGLKLGQINKFSGNSSGIAGLEMEAANQAGAGKRQLADLFRMGSQATSIYGMGQPATAAPTGWVSQG